MRVPVPHHPPPLSACIRLSVSVYSSTKPINPNQIQSISQSFHA